jgi:CspA family cold shock protein
MERGTVRWFNPVKGFGYISRQNGEVVFVQASAVTTYGLESLKKGQSVRFSVVKGPKGLQAESVTAL